MKSSPTNAPNSSVEMTLIEEVAALKEANNSQRTAWRSNQTGLTRTERDYLRNAINQRLINDQRDDVLAFFAEADLQQLPVFHSRTGSEIPQLDENADHWLAVLEVLLPRGIIPFSGHPLRMNSEQANRFYRIFQRHIDGLMTDQSLTYDHFQQLWNLLRPLLQYCEDCQLIKWQINTLPRKFIDYQRQQEPLTHADANLALQIASSLNNLVTHSVQALEEIHWRLNLHQEVGINNDTAIYEYGWQPLVHVLSDNDLLSLAGQNSKLDTLLIGEWSNREWRANNREQHWEPWSRYFEQHATFSNSFEQDHRNLPGNFQQLQQHWQNATTDPSRIKVLDSFLNRLSQCPEADLPTVSMMLNHMLATAPKLLARTINEHRYIELNAARFVARFGDKAAKASLVQRVACDYEQGWDKDSFTSSIDVIADLMKREPETARKLSSAQQLIAIAPWFTPEELSQLLPSLHINRKNGSKLLWKFWAEQAPQIPLSAFEAAKWFENPTQSLSRLGLEVLLAHPDPAATERLQSLYPEPADWMNSHDISRLDDCLLDTAGNSLPLEELERRAARITQMDDDVKRMLTTPLLEITHPLSEHATGVLLQLIKEAKSEPLSPLAIKLKNQLDSNKHLNLNRYLLETWISSTGHYQLSWAISQLTMTPDNSLADMLFSAIKRWHKRHWQEAISALTQLETLDTTYALIHIQTLTETRGIRKSVAERAERALHNAAQRQQLSLTELQDQLCPDFGLSDGITFNVGDQDFAVELQGDLTLRVRNAQGKLTKSIPKPKDKTLLTEWEQSKAQWKELNKNLKTVIKRQQPRMYAAFITGSKWSASRWQSLFLQSPLFRAMGQSLIWADNKGHSFRISEDGSLVRSDDEPYSLARNGQVSLWHPANTTPEARQEWQDYFADYEITPMIDQLNATAQLPTIPPDHPTGQIPIPDGVKVDCRALITLLKKLGYRSGARQHRGDTHDHYWSLAPEGLIIELHHAPISILYQEYYLHDRDKEYRSITLEHLTVSKETRDINEPVNIHGLPKALQATLQSHIDTLFNARISQ